MNFVRPKVPVILASAQTDMFAAAEYASDNTSDLHCRVIKGQHQTERLSLSRHLVQPTALITTQHHLGPVQFIQAEHKSNKVFRHALQSSPN